MEESLHKAQVVILHTLRHKEKARFSELMYLAQLASDVFKFHIRKLQALGYIERIEIGTYQLTATGKEFANKLDKTKRMVHRQPKLSLLIIVGRTLSDGTVQYLFQQRRRSPFFGFWSCVGGPARWGEDLEQSAAYELKKQTNLDANCIVRSFYRKRDFAVKTHTLLEDKLFVVLEAQNVQGEMSNAWYGGHNEWRTLAQFMEEPKRFDDVHRAIVALRSGTVYNTQDTTYAADDY